MIRLLMTLSMAAALAAPLAASEERGWYRLELESGDPLTVRLVVEEKDFYVFNFQGAVLRVEKAVVRKLERLKSSALPLPGRPVGEAGQPAPAGTQDPSDGGKQSAVPGVTVKAAADEEALRDAVEDLASPDDEEVMRAYRLLSRHFPASRPFAQLALSHQNARVRALSTKLLGERGAAKDDLAAVSGRLDDDRAEVRLAAAMAVRALGPEGFPKLVRYLNTEVVPNNRKMVVKTFQHWNDRRAVGPLVERLSRETDEGVRGFISVALEALTGRNLGRDAAAWAGYVEEAGRARDLEKMKQAASLAGEAGKDENHETRQAKE